MSAETEPTTLQNSAKSPGAVYDACVGEIQSSYTDLFNNYVHAGGSDDA